MDYLKDSIDGLALVGGKNLVGPFYSAVGRTWQQTAEEREHDMKILVEILRDLAEYASKKGIVLGLEPSIGLRPVLSPLLTRQSKSLTGSITLHAKSCWIHST